jgi:hypothetical protein
MSLWTPGGEHEVPRDQTPSAGPPRGPGGPLDEDDPLADLTPEQREQAAAMAADMDEVRRQVASVPGSLVVANHAMGLYELGAIHLSQEPPNFEDARLAIDALGILVEGLQGRLGDNEETLREALGQLRLAFVQLRGAASGDQATANGDSPFLPHDHGDDDED